MDLRLVRSYRCGMCVFEHMHVCVYVRACHCVHTCMCICTSVCAYMYMYQRVCVHVCVYVRACVWSVCVYMYVYMYYVCVYVRACVHTCMCTCTSACEGDLCSHVGSFNLTHVCVCICVCHDQSCVHAVRTVYRGSCMSVHLLITIICRITTYKNMVKSSVTSTRSLNLALHL